MKIYETLRTAVEEIAELAETKPEKVFEEVLDFNFLVSSNGELIGGDLFLTVGAPHIRIDMTSQYVVGNYSDYEYKVRISEKAWRALFNILQERYDDVR